MTLRLDPNDPTRTKIQYRYPSWPKGTPRILFVADGPDVRGNQIVILEANGVMGFRLMDGRSSQNVERGDDIINAPPDAEELLEKAAPLVSILTDGFTGLTVQEAKEFLADYAAWKASR